MTKWNVYLDGKYLDSVYFNPNHTADEVRKSLIDHDNFPSGITVRKAP
jgi:hypothetical protein